MNRFDILCLCLSGEIHGREMNEPLSAARFLLQGLNFSFLFSCTYCFDDLFFTYRTYIYISFFFFMGLDFCFKYQPENPHELFRKTSFILQYNFYKSPFEHILSVSQAIKGVSSSSVTFFQQCL